MNEKKRKLSHGFTMIELIIVMLLIVILSVVVFPRYTTPVLNLNAEVQAVLNDIRYTQGLSMTTGQRYRWVRVSATSYQITNQSGTPITMPSGGTQVTLGGGVSFGAFSNLPNNLIAFDSAGVPYTDTGTPGTPLSVTGIVNLTSTAGSSNIQIVPTTGYGYTP